MDYNEHPMTSLTSCYHKRKLNSGLEPMITRFRFFSVNINAIDNLIILLSRIVILRHCRLWGGLNNYDIYYMGEEDFILFYKTAVSTMRLPE